jgi:thymidine phosphorylase
MSEGTLFLVVGPSGAGKDTLLDGARAALATDDRFVFARRAITRPAEAGGEIYDAITGEEFARRRDAGGFLIAWSAHGLDYALPISLAQHLEQGRNVVANGSRATISELAKRIANLVIVEVTAPSGILAARLQSRGRESPLEIEARLARQTPRPPCDIPVVQIQNDLDVATGVSRLVATLTAWSDGQLRLRRMPIDSGREPLIYLPKQGPFVRSEELLDGGRVEISGGGRSLRGTVHAIEDGRLLARTEVGLSHAAFKELGLPEGAGVQIQRLEPPASINALRAKLRGDELDEGQIRSLIGDIVDGRYPEREVAAFLVAATRGLTDNEVAALARTRFEFAEKMKWHEDIVVDKHSIGGIPGSRITMILVSLIAAHGLPIPKTSSRAITSAAGTADAMETLARVDLSVVDVQRVVDQARGCVVWNGQLNHSAVDDVMNAITRPLGLDSTRWAVASILSKKLAAGSTHIIIDLPYGPQAKLKSLREAQDIAALFERIGRKLGVLVEAHPTDGSQPIGRGIGPALEVRDVISVLENRSEAPASLREKSLFFASRILAWDESVGSEARARLRAEELLTSGAARVALDRIVDAQGRRELQILPGSFSRVVKAERSGVVTEIDTWRIAGIARAAGAPSDLSAGIDIRSEAASNVREGDDLYVIRAGSEANAAMALSLASKSSGYVIR